MEAVLVQVELDMVAVAAVGVESGKDRILHGGLADVEDHGAPQSGNFGSQKAGDPAAAKAETPIHFGEGKKKEEIRQGD